MSEPLRCSICGQFAAEVCSTEVCRDCHVTESFEECMADVQVNALRRSRGLPEVER